MWSWILQCKILMYHSLRKLYADTLNEFTSHRIENAERSVEARRNTYVGNAFQTERRIRDQKEKLAAQNRANSTDQLAAIRNVIPSAKDTFTAIDP